MCDREKLKEAFSNIISNCIRYAKSKVVVEIKLQKDEFEVRVEDDGVGFKMMKLTKFLKDF